MSVDFSKFRAFPPAAAVPPPQPGEIWQVRRALRSPLTRFNSMPLSSYSLAAQRFLQGDFPAHYVMIVRALEPESAPEDAWQAFSAMVLSEETTFLSDVDVLIPARVSGVGKDLLAETWQVLPVLGCSLQQPVGNRLSRAIYDELMTVGDAAESSLAIYEDSSQRSLEALGLVIASPLTHQQPDIQAFHQQEADWSDVLTVPFTVYQTYLESLQWADVVLAKTLEVEQSLQSLTVVPLRTIARQTIQLRNWFNQLFEPGWLAISELTNSGVLHLGLSPSRQAETGNRIGSGSEGDDATSEEVSELIGQLSTASTEGQRRRAAKQLGAIASGNPAAIQALIHLLRSTEDDETLWTAVESLWQIDPGNPAAGVRRVRLIDLGLQITGQTVALAVAMIQRSDQRIGVMLRVYPTGDEPYVPENLKLILLDDFRQVYEVSARRNDLYMQLKFNGYPGEPFSVQISLGETSIIEDFVL